MILSISFLYQDMRVLREVSRFALRKVILLGENKTCDVSIAKRVLVTPQLFRKSKEINMHYCTEYPIIKEKMLYVCIIIPEENHSYPSIASHSKCNSIRWRAVFHSKMYNYKVQKKPINTYAYANVWVMSPLFALKQKIERFYVASLIFYLLRRVYGVLVVLHPGSLVW